MSTQKQFAFPVSYRPTSQEQLDRCDLDPNRGIKGPFTYIKGRILTNAFDGIIGEFGYIAASDYKEENGPIVPTEAAFLAIAGQVKEGERGPVVGCFYKHNKTDEIFQVRNVGAFEACHVAFPLNNGLNIGGSFTKNEIKSYYHLATPGELIAAFSGHDEVIDGNGNLSPDAQKILNKTFKDSLRTEPAKEVADKVDQAFNGSCGTRIPDGPVTVSSMSMNDDDQYVTRDLMNWSKPKETRTPDFDPVNHPAHYTDGNIEVIDFIEDKKLNYHLGQVVKYVSRAGKKDPSKEIEDLEKARWYLNRRIEQLQSH